MQNIKVEGPSLSINSGTVRLSAQQARDRRHNLENLSFDKKSGVGTYRVTGAIQFKSGEEFGFDGQIGKNGIAFNPEADAQAARDAEMAILARIKQAKEEGYQQGLAEIESEVDRRVAEEVAKLQAAAGSKQ